MSESISYMQQDRHFKECFGDLPYLEQRYLRHLVFAIEKKFLEVIRQ